MDRETASDFDPEEARATVARYETLLNVISDRLAQEALEQEIADLWNHIRDVEDGRKIIESRQRKNYELGTFNDPKGLDC